MKTRKPVSELALQLQELRRRNPQAYWILSKVTAIPEARVKAIARGEEPTIQEELVLKAHARG